MTQTYVREWRFKTLSDLLFFLFDIPIDIFFRAICCMCLNINKFQNLKEIRLSYYRGEHFKKQMTLITTTECALESSKYLL